MTSEKIKKIALWILASLTIVNIAILATLAYYFIAKPYHNPVKDNSNYYNFKECPANCDEVTFRKYSKFKNHYRNRTSPLVDSLRELRFAMMDELQKENPDTVKLNQLAEKSGIVYGKLREKTANQLMVMKDSFPPEFRRSFMNKCGRKECGEHRLRRNKFHKRHQSKEIRHNKIGDCCKN